MFRLLYQAIIRPYYNIIAETCRLLNIFTNNIIDVLDGNPV
jgi:hypothetical protein